MHSIFPEYLRIPPKSQNSLLNILCHTLQCDEHKLEIFKCNFPNNTIFTYF